MSAVVAVLLTGLLAPQEPAQATIQLAADIAVTGHMLVDIDVDGLDDLVLACRDAASGQRYLQRHVRRASGPAYSSAPSGAPIPIDRDVVAFTFCDCRPAKGPELILLTGEQVVVVVGGGESDNGESAPRFERLARHVLVWPAADTDQVLPLPESAVDFDRDGDVDLLLPRPDGWSVLLQDEGRFERRVELLLPPRESQFAGISRGRGGTALFGDGGSGEGGSGPGRPGSQTLVRTSARAPRCDLVDFDGNGFDDLVTFRNGACVLGLQASAGALTRSVLPLPLPEDRLELLDPSFDVQFTDIDGDGRADLLLTTSARRDDDVEARIDWFLTRPDGSWSDQRDGRLRLQPLAAPARLVDVDGDGRRDLVCLSVRTSAMRAFTGDSAKAIDAQLTAFRNDGGGFVRPAALSQALPLEPGPRGLAEPFLRARPRTGDAPGAILLRADGALQLRPLAPRGNRLRLLPATLRTAVPEGARIVPATADGEEILIVAGNEVRHVRFR